METIQTIKLDELDTLARALLGEQHIDEPLGSATNRAKAAGKLVLEGDIAEMLDQINQTQPILAA